MSDFESVLESGFQEATNRETFARQIEAKIKEIPGAAALLVRASLLFITLGGYFRCFVLPCGA